MLGKTEPVAVAAAIRAVILCAVAFGLQLTPEQIAAVMLAVEAILALVTRQAVTPNDKVPDLPPRLPIVLLAVGLSLSLSACASAGGPRHIATVSVVSAHAVLSAVQDTEMAIVCDRAGAPAPPACVPQAKHQAISGKLAKAFDYDAQVARLVRALPVGVPQPPEVAQLLAEIGAIVNSIIAELPSSAQKATLVQNLSTGGVK